MGHNVGDAAARSVKKSEKVAEKAARTDAQIFVDIEKLLDAHLSVPPADIRLLLTRYKETKLALNDVVERHTTQHQEETDGSQEETASGSEERSVTRVVGTIEAIS